MKQVVFCAVLCLVLGVLQGCGAGVTAIHSLPSRDASLDQIWAYASGLAVEEYAARRFGSFPDGLRRAVTRHRIDFLADGGLPGNAPELQSYLFFEYRRQKSRPKDAAIDADTVRYVRALVAALNDRPRR